MVCVQIGYIHKILVMIIVTLLYFVIEDMADMDDGSVFVAVDAGVSYRPASHFVVPDAFCLLCEFSAQDQTDARLREVLLQLEERVRSTGIGLQFKVRAVAHTYATVVRPLLPATAPVWTAQSIGAHLSGLHSNASVAMVKQLDVSQYALYAKILDDHMYVSTGGGAPTLNMPVLDMRLKLARIIQTTEAPLT